MVTNSSANIPTGASGTVLQGQDVGTASAFSTATFPSTATSTGTILRADGTNWAATTATYPATTTAFQLLASTATSVVGEITAGTTGTVLTGVTGAVPAFSATPTLTSVTFGAGSALDAYSTGTFTPTLKFGGLTTGITYSTQAGKYWKIGNLVFYAINVTLTSKGSATGAVTITGMPFAAANDGWGISGQVGLVTVNAYPTGTTSPYVYVSAGTSTLNLLCEGSSTNAQVVNDTTFTNTTICAPSGWYWTA